MIVCLCTGSSDRDVARALEAGAKAVSEIGESCGAGRDCGYCHSALLAILEGRSCEGCPSRDTLECDRLQRAQSPEMISV